MLLLQIIATMISTAKLERNNLPFTIENIPKGEFNWNIYEITPPCYVINICILYRLYFKQHDFLKEKVIGYPHANFHHATTFGCRNIAFQIWQWIFIWWYAFVIRSDNMSDKIAYNNTVTSQWARWRFKSPASWLFAQPFIQVQIKENIKAPRHWPLRGEFTGDQWIPCTKGQ